MNNQPLLSICIPTYNRADILDSTLSSITTDPAFDEEVEIVISDNFSTDDTYKICEKYTTKFPNVKYFRNEQNVRDRNFYLVLTRANGAYLKIINDTVSFKEGKLEAIKQCVRKSEDKNSLLFPPLSGIVKTRKCVFAKDKNDLLRCLSYNSTWIATFGIWKKDVAEYCKDVDFSSQLAQVSWIYKQSTSMQVDLYFDDYYNVIWTSNKGNYNYFHVFLDNYLKILREYSFKRLTFEKEKFRLLGLLMHYYYMMKFSNKVSYNSQNSFSKMFKEYWYEPYFYLLFPLHILARFLYNLIK